MAKIVAAELCMYIALAFLLMASSGVVIKAVRTRLQRNGIGMPRAVSTIGLFRLARQYSQLAKRKGWSLVLGWLPLPLQIFAFFLLFRGGYLIKQIAR